MFTTIWMVAYGIIDDDLDTCARRPVTKAKTVTQERPSQPLTAHNKKYVIVMISFYQEVAANTWQMSLEARVPPPVQWFKTGRQNMMRQVEARIGRVGTS